jgi:hypothetical protein
MSGRPGSLVAIYEKNIAGVGAYLARGKGTPKKLEDLRRSLARLQYRLALAKAGTPLPTCAEEEYEKRRRSDHLYAIW